MESFRCPANLVCGLVGIVTEEDLGFFFLRNLAELLDRIKPGQVVPHDGRADCGRSPGITHIDGVRRKDFGAVVGQIQHRRLAAPGVTGCLHHANTGQNLLVTVDTFDV